MSSALISASQDRTVFVLDIPASIEHAQGHGRLFSQLAPEEPYQTPEPKGAKRGVYLAQFPPSHLEYQERLEKEILQARSRVSVDVWHLPRITSSSSGDFHDQARGASDSGCECTPVILSALHNEFTCFTEVQNTLVHNDNAQVVHLLIEGTTAVHIPARCTFGWTDIDHARSLMSDSYLETRNDTPIFDVVLMDPPWTNRSVRHGKQYSTDGEQQTNPTEAALQLASKVCKTGGYIAIWVTNKAAIRRQVLDTMWSMNLQLVEEWVWVKVTKHGEPVTALNGVWRKPYEVMLLFQRRADRAELRRRYIFAVPDLHSRKPNLKTLFEELLDANAVLELFARNLTAVVPGDDAKQPAARDVHAGPLHGTRCTSAIATRPQTFLQSAWKRYLELQSYSVFGSINYEERRTKNMASENQRKSVDVPEGRKAFVPLENNPEVMTRLAHQLGLSEKLQFHEVYSLTEPALLEFLPRPAHALLLVFPVTETYEKFRREEDGPKAEYTGSGADEPVIWYKQTIRNACGLIGLLHSITNGEAKEQVVAGSGLEKLIRDAIPLDPIKRADLLYESQSLEAAHATAAASGDTTAPDANAAVDLHFVAFIKDKDNNLWELDGRRKGPLNRGKLGASDDVLSELGQELGVKAFLKREEEAGGGELRFSVIMLGPSMD